MLVLQRTPQKASFALYNRIQSPRGFYMQNIFYTRYALTKAHFPEETRNVFSVVHEPSATCLLLMLWETQEEILNTCFEKIMASDSMYKYSELRT